MIRLTLFLKGKGLPASISGNYTEEEAHARIVKANNEGCLERFDAVYFNGARRNYVR